MRTTTGVTAVFLSLSILTMGAAHAATTYSPPVRSSQGDVLGCVAVNSTGNDISVTAEINSGFDLLVESATLVIPSGESRTVASTTTAVFGAYCVFTFEGSADDVRGYIRLFDLGGSNTRLLYPASESRGATAIEVNTYSPPVRSSDGDVLSCVAQNLSSQSVQVDASLYNGVGGVVASGTLNIAAGRVQVVASTTTAVFGAYCKFTFDANPRAVRGYVQLFDLGGSNTRLLYPASTIMGGRPTTGARTYSPPVRSSDGDVLSCRVQNLSLDPVEVSAEINNGLGSVVDINTLTIQPGWVQTVVSSTTAVFGAYCQFTFDGNPSAVRGYIQLFDFGGSNTRLLYPAGPVDQQIDTFLGPIPAASGAVDGALAGIGPVILPPQSPPVRSSDGDVLGCWVQNLSNTPVNVDAQINSGLATVVASGELTIQPGRVQAVTSTTTAVFGAFCQFLPSNPSSEVRGYIQLFDLGGSNTRLLYSAYSPSLPTVAPTPTPSHTPTQVPTAVDTPTPTHSATTAPTAVDTPTPSHSPTTAPTGVDTPTPVATGTQTADPTAPTTEVPTVASTPTQTGAPLTCVGDCNGDGSVSISELVTLVNIALGNRPVADCPAGDRDGDGNIVIAELIAAVNNALAGCP